MSGADAAGAVDRFYRRIVWRVCAPAAWVLWPALALACAGCGGQPAAPSPPPPDPATQVTPIDNTGPVRITFAAANIAPGSVVAGCGPAIEGCAGRMEMTFQLDPSFDGPVLSMRIYLHATNMIACLWGETPPFTVQGRVASTVRVPITNADRCGTPTTIATMAAVVEGPTQIGSRQTWSLHYVFAP